MKTSDELLEKLSKQEYRRGYKACLAQIMELFNDLGNRLLEEDKREIEDESTGNE